MVVVFLDFLWRKGGGVTREEWRVGEKTGRGKGGGGGGDGRGEKGEEEGRRKGKGEGYRGEDRSC